MKQSLIEIKSIIEDKDLYPRDNWDWNLNFVINYNDELISDHNILMRILEEAGQRIGLLDNRPQRYGENGTFKITKFLPLK